MPYNTTRLGDTPYLFRGAQADLKRLFYSPPEIALTVEVTLPPGYGIVPQGTVLAKVSESSSGQRVGMYVPYTTEQPATGSPLALGAAYLLVNGAADTNVYVGMEDSYKFAVGDHLAVADSDTYTASAVDLGAITAIDRTTYTHQAVISSTNNVTTAFTVANGAWVWIQSTTSAPFTLAKGILIGAVDTGVGADAKGGNGVMVVSNALLYEGMMINYTSHAATDLGSSTIGQYVVLK